LKLKLKSKLSYFNEAVLNGIERLSVKIYKLLR